MNCVPHRDDQSLAFAGMQPVTQVVTMVCRFLVGTAIVKHVTGSDKLNKSSAYQVGTNYSSRDKVRDNRSYVLDI